MKTIIVFMCWFNPRSKCR